MIIEAAIQCVVNVLYQNKHLSDFSSEMIAKELTSKFGFIQDKDFTLNQIEEEMKKYTTGGSLK